MSRGSAAGASLAGGAMLTRLAARRERISAPLGVLAMPLLIVVTGASMSSLYADTASRDSLRSGAAANPAFRLLLGPLGSDTSTVGITTWRVGLFLLVVAAIVAALTVTRHGRADEDSGRLEVVRAGAVGPLAPMASAVASAVVVGLVIGVVVAGATAIVGASALSATVIGVQFTTVSLAAVGVAAIADQTFATARGARTAAVTILVGGYVLRGVGDLADGFGWLRWVSPVGWGELIDPLGHRRALPAIAGVVVCVIGVSVAAAIARRRDLGEGLFARGPGPAGTRRLRSIGSLVARVSLPGVVPWVGATAAYCLLLGFLLSSVTDLVPSGGGVTDIVRDLGGAGSLAQSVMTAVLGFVGVIAAAAAVSVVACARGDESSGRTEQVLATATSRTRFYAATVGAALVAVVLVLAGASIAVVVGHTITTGAAAPTVSTVLGAGAVQIPGSIAVAAVAVAAYGWGSRWVPLGWVALVADTLLAQFGELLGLPQWIRDLAPHTHVTGRDPGTIGLAPLVVTLVVAVALIAVGGWGFSRRDIPD